MKIAHLADIQVRAHSRHEEFEKSFLHLYKSLEKKKPDRIVLAGDIVHNKTNISPELVDIVARFFGNLCNIAPVDLILGNHDLAMKNQERMDALSPIVHAMNNPHLRFYRRTQLAVINNDLQYVVMSCVDDKKDWDMVRRAALKDKERVSIALWHGTINGVHLDNGSTLESPHGLEIFKGLDYAMLGDIHKTQILDDEKRVAYPGSYPKQNFGEGETGGYFLWNIQSKDEHQLEFVELPTVCPYHTLTLGDDLAVHHDAHIGAGARIRVMCRPMNVAERKIVTDSVTELYRPTEFKIVSTGSVTPGVVISSNVSLENLRDEKAQEKLLAEYVKDQNLSEDQLKILFQLNKECSVSQPDVLRNVRYKFKSLAFENLFSFGEGKENKVEFKNHKGILGVFGQNAAGKSSLVVDIPLYCLFNKISKDISKNQHYVNDRSEYAKASMNIMANDQSYNIVRKTDMKRTKKRDGSVVESSETNVWFQVEKKNNGGIDRADTDKKIRSVFGSAEDFMLTSVAAQFDLLGFVANKATDRKKLIAKYFDLQVFEEKFKQANDSLRGFKRQVQALEDCDFDAQIAAGKKNLVDLSTKLAECEHQADASRRLYELGRKKTDELKAAQSDEETKMKVQAAEIRAEYASLRTRMEEKSQELKDFKTYSCMGHRNCYLYDRKKAVKNSITNLNTKLGQLRETMTEFVDRLNALREEKAPLAEQIKEQERLCTVYLQKEREMRQALQQNIRDVAGQEIRIESLQKQQKELSKLQEKMHLQVLYAQAMGKDGLSYQIVTRNLSKINDEIAAILGDDMHFSVWLEDDDKEINVYLQNQGEKPRLIELCSGMEQTIAAIAIRASLIGVTTLPVSNIFVLDESFTALDPSHMNALGRVLNGLKRIFETIVLICHNDYVKDLCDSIIMIEKDDKGYSHINA